MFSQQIQIGVFLSEKISWIIIAGGLDGSFRSRIASVEVMISDLRSTRQISDLPAGIIASSMVLHNGTILLCGGSPENLKNCLKLDHKTWTWKKHSKLNQKRFYHSAVSTIDATFIFGGKKSRDTYEYLPKGSTTWLMGKCEIPEGFDSGCAVVCKPRKEIWLIGGLKTEKRILSFNINDHTFQLLPSRLNVGRLGHKCAFIPNTNKIMISGGSYNGDLTKSTEILDPLDGSVNMASQMNFARCGHGMSVVTVDGVDRLAVFGGLEYHVSYHDSVELYNAQTDEWETTDIKLEKPKGSFSFLTLKHCDIISEI